MHRYSSKNAICHTKNSLYDVGRKGLIFIKFFLYFCLQFGIRLAYLAYISKCQKSEKPCSIRLCGISYLRLGSSSRSLVGLGFTPLASLLGTGGRRGWRRSRLGALRGGRCRSRGHLLGAYRIQALRRSRSLPLPWSLAPP